MAGCRACARRFSGRLHADARGEALLAAGLQSQGAGRGRPPRRLASPNDRRNGFGIFSAPSISLPIAYSSMAYCEHTGEGRPSKTRQPEAQNAARAKRIAELCFGTRQ
jgi:hypothetical protein